MGAAALSLWLPGDHQRSGNSLADGCFISGCDDDEGCHFMAGFDFTGRRRFILETPQRMHAAALNPAQPQQLVFFARRPGTEIYSIDLHSATVIQRLASGTGRHFCGHGCFSADGRYLFSAESDYVKNRGVVSVRDAATLEVLEEWTTHGPDPHELRLLDGGNTLVIANGGILTSPDRPGVNLDPAAMQPSLVYLDTSDGKMRGEFRLQDSQLSIRHIDVNDNGLVAIALQYAGPAENRVPLLASHAGEDALQLFTHDACDWRRLNQYTGSIEFGGGVIAAVSSPRGNCLSFWDMAERRMLAQHYIHDVCGIAYDAGRRNFIATTGAGNIYRFDAAGRAASGGRMTIDRIRWDNHLLVTA